MFCIGITQKKEKYGPMMNSLIKTGVPIKLIEEIEPDDEVIIFHNKPVSVKAKKVGWWMCDLREPQTLGHSEYHFDKIFLCNTEFIEKYKEFYNTDVVYLPQCGDDTNFSAESFWDIVWIGNFNSEYHNNRKDIIVKLQKEFNVKIVSGGDYSTENKYLYRDTPISLAISPQVAGYTSNRLYNILASGGFCLTLYYPEIEKEFENKKHLVWFKTPSEAVELAKYYLEHQEERNKIAKQGHKLYLEKHTGKHRVNFMLDKLDSV